MTQIHGQNPINHHSQNPKNPHPKSITPPNPWPNSQKPQPQRRKGEREVKVGGDSQTDRIEKKRKKKNEKVGEEREREK